MSFLTSDTLPPPPPTPQEQAAAIRHINRHALDPDDRAELIAMLGLSLEGTT